MEDNNIEKPPEIPKFKVEVNQVNQNTFKITIINGAGTKFVSHIQNHCPSDEQCLEWFKNQFNNFFIEAEVLDISKV